MISHRKVQRLFYDYLTGEVDASNRGDIETHLRGCARCSAELNDMREAVGMLPAAPAAERPDEFWDALLAKVQEQIRTEEPRPVRQQLSVSRWIDSLFIVRRPSLAFALVIAVCVAAALAVWVITFPAKVPHRDSARDLTGPGEDLHFRTGQYLRRSQTLLVGLANMKTSDHQPIDLTAEREASRALIHESRSLKQEELDPASAQVVYGLEPILVELANSRGDQSRAAVDLIRRGIFERNLLFKVRMAELMRDSTRFLAVSSGF